MALLLASSSGLEQQNKESNVKVRENSGVLECKHCRWERSRQGGKSRLSTMYGVAKP